LMILPVEETIAHKILYSELQINSNNLIIKFLLPDYFSSMVNF